MLRRNNEIQERQGHKGNSQIGLSNLAQALRDAGALREAAGALRQALVLNRELESAFQEGVSLKECGRVLSATGGRESNRLMLRRSLHIDAQRGDQQGQDVACAYLAERWLWLGDFTKALAYANRAWELSANKKAERDFVRAALFQGRAALGLSDLNVADERLHHALTRARAVNMVEFELPALIAIADLARQRNDLAGAKASLDEVWDAAERGPYPLYLADAYNLAADIAWVESDKRTAIEAATKAYRAAWCDGPPWAYHWGLEKAKAFLREFGAPEPEMPPFDESKIEPMPEVEINPKDEYWIDPATLD